MVITSTTGNRVAVKSGPRVRIPPTPPHRSKRDIACSVFLIRAPYSAAPPFHWLRQSCYDSRKKEAPAKQVLPFFAAWRSGPQKIHSFCAVPPSFHCIPKIARLTTATARPAIMCFSSFSCSATVPSRAQRTSTPPLATV